MERRLSTSARLCQYCGKRELPYDSSSTCHAPECQYKHHKVAMREYWKKNASIYSKNEKRDSPTMRESVC